MLTCLRFNRSNSHHSMSPKTFYKLKTSTVWWVREPLRRLQSWIITRTWHLMRRLTDCHNLLSNMNQFRVTRNLISTLRTFCFSRRLILTLTSKCNSYVHKRRASSVWCYFSYRTYILRQARYDSKPLTLSRLMRHTPKGPPHRSTTLHLIRHPTAKSQTPVCKRSTPTRPRGRLYRRVSRSWIRTRARWSSCLRMAAA